MRFQLVRAAPFETGRLGSEGGIWPSKSVALTAIGVAFPDQEGRILGEPNRTWIKRYALDLSEAVQRAVLRDRQSRANRQEGVLILSLAEERFVLEGRPGEGLDRELCSERTRGWLGSPKSGRCA